MNDNLQSNQHDDKQTSCQLAGLDMGIHEQGSLSVEDLFSGRQEVRLSYEGQEYRLRITRNRKLILTK